MRLTESVSAGDQRDGFFVVHRHARERLANIDGRSERIGVSVRAFRIHVNQAHLHCRERILEVAFAGVALVREPHVFGTPVGHLVGLPRVDASAGEAERLESHRFQRAVSGEDHEIGPRDLAAVLLFDRPEQMARLVEVRVVRPAVERLETLLARSCTAAPVADAIGSRAMPGHANEERPIVPVVGRPPILRRGHQRENVRLDRFEIEAVELARVVEVGTHRIGERGRPVKHREVQELGKPIDVHSRPERYVFYRTASVGIRQFGKSVFHFALLLRSDGRWTIL